MYRVSSDAADADLGDNELSHTRTVDGADTADGAGHLGLAVFAAIVVAVLLVVALVMRRRA